MSGRLRINLVPLCTFIPIIGTIPNLAMIQLLQINYIAIYLHDTKQLNLRALH